jgi:hypothetical protein
LVSSSFSQFRQWLVVVQEMRRLSAWRLEVNVGQEAAILSLRVWGQVEKGMEEAPGVQVWCLW